MSHNDPNALQTSNQEQIPSYQELKQQPGATDMATSEKGPQVPATMQHPAPPNGYQAQASGTAHPAPVINQPPVQMMQTQPGQVPVQTVCEHHLPNRRFGIVGIIIGICFCPCGLIWTFQDTRTECSKCGEIIKQGSCFSGGT